MRMTEDWFSGQRCVDPEADLEVLAGLVSYSCRENYRKPNWMGFEYWRKVQ